MISKRKTILLTGGSGYIGSHMIEYLKKNQYIPINIDIKQPAEVSESESIFFKGDISDTSLIKKIYQLYKFDSVIHFAAYTSVEESTQDPLKYYENNLSSTIKLVSTLNELGIKNIIFSSTASVYAITTSISPMHEDHPVNPINPYGKSKWMIEEVLKDCCQIYGMNILIFRYFNVSGGNKNFIHNNKVTTGKHLIPNIFNAISANKVVEIFGKDYPTKDGTCIRDYIHVDDLCRAHYLALTFFHEIEMPAFKILNLGSGIGYSVIEIIQTVERVIGKKIETRFAERRLGDPPILIADISRANHYLNWFPICSDIGTIVNDMMKLHRVSYDSINFELS